MVCTVDVTVDGKEEKILQMARNPKAAIAVTTIYEPPRAAQTDERPVVIGFGPGGMFAAGEVLDIDGDCGGFNLQWAWSSGYVAGKLGKGGEDA